MVIIRSAILLVLLHTPSHTISPKKNPDLSTTINGPGLVIKKDTEPATKEMRMVTLTNNITDAMQGYTYFFITYQPTEFKITTHDMLIEPGKSYTLPITNNQLELTYFCDFKYGYRQSTQTYVLMLQPNTTQVTITFDWQAQPHIMVQESSTVSSVITQDKEPHMLHASL